MHYSIDIDNGSTIIGYFVPDNGAERPVIDVFSEGQRLLRLPCNEQREAVRLTGRHKTGLVVFHFDEGDIATLASLSDLEIRDARTGLLIYRRPSEHHLPVRVLRLETRLVADDGIDRAFADRFQYFLKGADRYGQETSVQALTVHGVGSIYVSGRLLYRNYIGILPDEFVRLVMLQDPYVELAERLLLLRRGVERAPTDISDRDIGQLMFGFDWIEEVNLDDEHGLSRALRSVPPRVRQIIQSPLVQQLASTTPDELVTPASLTAALDTLSEFTVIGHREEGGALAHDLATLFEVPHETIAVPPAAADALALADRLRGLQVAEELLAEDLVLHHYVRSAREGGQL